MTVKSLISRKDLKLKKGMKLQVKLETNTQYKLEIYPGKIVFLHKDKFKVVEEEENE